MTNDQSTPSPESKTGTGAPLRMIGTIVLVVGLAGAGLGDGFRKTPEGVPNELADPAGYKRSARDVDTMYGKLGGFSYALTQDLKDPVIEAAIIAIGSVI